MFGGDTVFTVAVGTLKLRVKTVTQAAAMEVANKANWSKTWAQGNNPVVKMPD